MVPRSSVGWLSRVLGIGAALICLVGPALAHDSLPAQIAQVTREIAANPGSASLHLRRGELYRAARRWTEALADLDHTARLDATLVEVDRVRAHVLFALSRHDEAVSAASRYLTSRPGDHDAHTIRARARVARHWYRDAVADFTAAIAVRPLPDLYVERARAERRLGPAGAAAALRGLDEGLRRLGSIVTLELEALDLEIETGAVDAALARLDRLAATSPRQESWLLRRGTVLERAGRRHDAIASYRAALAAANALPPWTQQTRATRDMIATLHRHLTRLDEASSPASHPSPRTQP